jgi:hypothetical protein
MSHEVAEKIEHAAHSGGGKISRYIGITMAAIGVMLAICSAMVGGERTELVKTMVIQSNTYTEYQAASSKYRTLLAQTQQVYATSPSRKLLDSTLGDLAGAPTSKEQTEMAARERDELKALVTLLTPRKAEIEDLIHTVERYNEERKAAKDWAESYDDEVEVHIDGSERFEKAQLIAEIGIVVASIALLLASRIFWVAGIIAALGCAGMLGTTYMGTRKDLHTAEAKIETAKEHYMELHNKKDASGKRIADAHDDDTLVRIRERFGISATGPEKPER